MITSRQQLSEEVRLRETIRKAIKFVQNKKRLEERVIRKEEWKFRQLVRTLINETEVPEPDEAPHESTGINVLEDLLKKIIPILETDFKKLTTIDSQRTSYRAHILQAVMNTLAPARATERAKISEQEDITIKVEDEPEEFIDVRGETQIEEPSEAESFGIEGEDETGRDMALSTFKRIEANIVDSWEVLYSNQDKELFYDYLLTNLKLYFDKFEDELKATLPEPTTPEYEEEKNKLDIEAAEVPEEEEPLGL